MCAASVPSYVLGDLLQLFAGDLLFLEIGLFVDELGVFHDIARAEQQEAFAGQAIAARAASFLIIAFDVFGQIVVDDEADVRLVDPHAEGDGRADHAHVVAQKQFLVFGTLPRGESGVVRPGRHALFGQSLGHALGGFAALAINDAAFPGPSADVFEHLLVRPGLGLHAIGEIGPVETGDVTARLAQAQLLEDVGPDAFGGRGGERHQRHFREEIAQARELAVLGPEIMSPFADAMRLVDGDELGLPAPQVVEKTGKHQPFGRGIEQTKLALVQPAQARAGFLRLERGIQKRGGHAAGLEGVHLVFHQRDEGRNDDGQAGPGQGGQLETERFAAAGGQEREDVASRQRVADDFFLQRAKRGEAEGLLQQRQQRS